MASKAQMPRGWRLVRLGDVAEINPRRPPLSVPAETPVTFLPMAAIAESSQGIVARESRPYSEVSTGYTYFEENDFLFSKITPCLQNGKHTLATGLRGGFGFGTTEFHVVRTSSILTAPFMFRALTQAHIIDRCSKSFTGTAGQQRVQPETLKDLPILLPPLPEQRAIAAVLDSIDDAIEGAEAVIAATGQLRDSLLHQLLTRGVPGWHTAWKDVTGLGTMPADWDVVSLGDVAEIVMGQSPPGGKCNRVEDGVPLLNGPTEFGPYYPTPVQWTTDPKKGAGVGDILFCVRGATAGRMNWSDRDYAIGRGIASLKHKGGPAYQSFLRAVIDFRLAELLTVVTGSTFPNLSYDQITQLRVPRVPSSEQQAIADTLDGIDGVLVQRRLERDALRSLKDSTADALLTGLVKAIR